MKNYTTGRAAKLCGISQQSIIRAFDDGHIPGGFRLPGQRYRWIPRSALLAFMLAVGIPVSELAPFTDEERAAIEAARPKTVGPLKLTVTDRMGVAS